MGKTVHHQNFKRYGPWLVLERSQHVTCDEQRMHPTLGLVQRWKRAYPTPWIVIFGSPQREVRVSFVEERVSYRRCHRRADELAVRDQCRALLRRRSV